MSTENLALKTIEGIKHCLNSFFGPVNQAPVAPAPVAAPVQQAATESTLQDGTAVSISNLQAGGTMSIKDATGAEAPCPPGEYCLSDGTCVTVAENGIIASVTPPAMPAAPPADMSALAGDLAKTKTMCEAMEQDNAQTKQAFEAFKSNVKESFEKILDLVKEVAEQPTGQTDPEVKPTPLKKFDQKDKTPLSEKFASVSTLIVK